MIRVITCAVCGRNKPTKGDHVICSDCRSYKRRLERNRKAAAGKPQRLMGRDPGLDVETSKFVRAVARARALIPSRDDLARRFRVSRKTIIRHERQTFKHHVRESAGHNIGDSHGQENR